MGILIVLTPVVGINDSRKHPVNWKKLFCRGVRVDTDNPEDWDAVCQKVIDKSGWGEEEFNGTPVLLSKERAIYAEDEADLRKYLECVAFSDFIDMKEDHIESLYFNGSPKGLDPNLQV